MNVFDKKVVDSIAMSVITASVLLMALVLSATHRLEAQTVVDGKCIADTNLYTFIPDKAEKDFLLSKKYYKTFIGMKAEDIETTNEEVVCPITYFYSTMKYLIDTTDRVCGVTMSYPDVSMCTLMIDLIGTLNRVYGANNMEIKKLPKDDGVRILLKHVVLIVEDLEDTTDLTIVKR